MGSRSQTCSSYRMVLSSTGGHWKRPINRMYSYNYQVGESYYLPMTSYLDTKTEGEQVKSDLPGPLSFSERIAVNALNDTPLPQETKSHLTLRKIKSYIWMVRMTKSSRLTYSSTTASI